MKIVGFFAEAGAENLLLPAVSAAIVFYLESADIPCGCCRLCCSFLAAASIRWFGRAGRMCSADPD